MAGILYVVATPIGNLEDVTLRALRILREVSLIAAEDTRRTARLLQHYSISTRTTSLHAHNEREKTPQLVAKLAAGQSIAVVSDAGTPLISDPGQPLVKAARDAGIRVEAIPGPSAVMAALSSSGLPTSSFAFTGFPPIRSKDRIGAFREWKSRQVLTVFFEAPHRLEDSLRDLAAVFGANHIICVARELTKAHEQLVVRPISGVLKELSALKGELTLLVPPVAEKGTETAPVPSVEELREELGRITKNTGSRGRAALKVLAEKYTIPVNRLYEMLEAGPRGVK